MATETKEESIALTLINAIKRKIDFLIDCPDDSFVVLHPIDGSLNISCDKDIEYRLVYMSFANSLEDVFRSAQNENQEYNRYGIRSTCVGDIIVRCNDLNVYIIQDIGFKEVPFSWVAFVDPKNHVQSI